MKEIKLKTNITYEFDLLGITSSFKDYKLAWLINNCLKFNLIKGLDHVVEYTDVKKIEVSCFQYNNHGTLIKFLSNKVYKENGQQQEYLVPEHKHFDFFLLIEGQDTDVTNLTNKLKQITGLEFITQLDIMKLRSKENFIL